MLPLQLRVCTGVSPGVFPYVKADTTTTDSRYLSALPSLHQVFSGYIACNLKHEVISILACIYFIIAGNTVMLLF